MKANVLQRAQLIVSWFATRNRDPKNTAKVYFPFEYRKMMRVFRDSCFSFTESDVSKWEELIRILTAQERATKKQK